MKRLKYTGALLFRMLTLLVAISLISFILIIRAPVDPIASYAGKDNLVTKEQEAQISAYWGLDKPAPERFLIWAGHILKGDMGDSIVYRQPVLRVIGERFRYSLALMLTAWLLSGVIGFLLGILAGVKEGKVIDQIIKAFCLLISSSPTFWIGLLILSIFSVKLGWFPIGLAAPIGKMAQDVTLAERVHHLVLPALTLSLLGIAKITLFTRQKLIEVMHSNYVLFAKARGENTRQIVMRHGLRNIALPAVTLQFASFSELFGGISLAETVFSYPGLGSATVNAGLNGDVPLLLGIAVFTALFVFIGNLIANLLYGIIDPRMRSENYGF